MDIRDNVQIEATFCFVDIAGYTALTETHGDEAAADLVTLFGALLERAAAERGKVLEVIGDGALILCQEPAKAVAVVSELVRAARHVPHFPRLRIGLHQGYALHRGGRFFGTTLNLAARISAQAQGGQVLASQQVAEAARSQGIRVCSIGAFRPRNLSEQVELFELHLEEAELETEVDPVCRMRVQRQHAAEILEIGAHHFWFCSSQCAQMFVSNPAMYIQDGWPTSS